MTDKANNLFKDVPQIILDYINKHYIEFFLSDVTSEIDGNYNVYYNVSASLENVIYHLKFDSDGMMVQRTIESLNEIFSDEFADYD